MNAEALSPQNDRDHHEAAAPLSPWRRAGVWIFVFFLAKGILWLALPLVAALKLFND